MIISAKTSVHVLVCIAGLFTRKKSTAKQVQKYMEFYYPTTGKITYNIIFDWGEYIITTEDKPDADVHADSKPYLGYITFRPEVAKPKPSPDQPLPFYIITPSGDVWENVNGHGIAVASKRQEVTKEKSAHGISTKTLTIESGSEAIIDHFKAHPDKWTPYGRLERWGKKVRLKLK